MEQLRDESVSLSGKEIGAIIGVGTISAAALAALGTYIRNLCC